MGQSEKKGMDVYSEEDRVVVTVNSITREGDRLCMEGKLMGAWDAKMYVDSQNTVNLIKLMLNRSFIGYVLSLPTMLLRNKGNSSKVE